MRRFQGIAEKAVEMPVVAVHLVSVSRIEFPDPRRLHEMEAVNMGKVELLQLGDIIKAFEIIDSQVVPA